MKPIIMEFSDNSSQPIYIQLYNTIKASILSGEMKEGERLPSLRSLSKTLNISITTTQLAYNQLLVEGYIHSKPQSGYYVSQVYYGESDPYGEQYGKTFEVQAFKATENPFIYDRDCFDFTKWKKCIARVFNDYSDLLFFESVPQGEAALRFEISKYVYSSRGVTCSPEQVVIGAGTQQITGHLCRILNRMNMGHVSLESPGYLPVQSIFRDRGFTISQIPVFKDGIDVSKLPMNIASAVYVSPSNQFPTGAVMSAGRRHRLLDWALENNSIIIEDDYDSELRYFGKPVPALKSLDKYDRVVYLGSFSSTLFAAVKISYMVLPMPMAKIFNQIKDQYTQTCSKSEQLALALFMENGYYATGIKKLRSLYSQKLSQTLQSFANHGGEIVETADTKSGINLIIRVRSKKSADKLCSMAKSIGLQMTPVSSLSNQETSALIFYYNRLPLGKIDKLIEELISLWQG